jgi:hypothetical protein
MATAIDDCSLSLTSTPIFIHTIMGNSGKGNQAVEVSAVHSLGQGDQDQDQDHGDGARVGDDQCDQHPQHTVEDAQVGGGQSSRNNRTKKDFRIVKKRGIIPENVWYKED